MSLLWHRAFIHGDLHPCKEMYCRIWTTKWNSGPTTCNQQSHCHHYRNHCLHYQSWSQGRERTFWEAMEATSNPKTPMFGTTYSANGQAVSLLWCRSIIHVGLHPRKEVPCRIWVPLPMLSQPLLPLSLLQPLPPQPKLKTKEAPFPFNHENYLSRPYLDEKKEKKDKERKTHICSIKTTSGGLILDELNCMPVLGVSKYEFDCAWWSSRLSN